MFQFPIGIQLFNRPDYAEKLLRSIQSQSLLPEQDKIYIVIDGYRNSRDERNQLRDLTEKVYEAALDFFPKAHFLRNVTNLGPGGSLLKLQSAIFQTNYRWAAFFEEDLILDKSHLKVLDELISLADPIGNIAKVGCFQASPTSLNNISENFVFYHGSGTQAFAERKSFFIQRKEISKVYAESEMRSFRANSQSVTLEELATLSYLGVGLIYLQHDSFIDNILGRNGLLHVVLKPNLASDIGRVGIHNMVTKNFKSPASWNHFDGLSFREKSEMLRRDLPRIEELAKENSKSSYKELVSMYYQPRSLKGTLVLLLKKIFCVGC